MRLFRKPDHADATGDAIPFFHDGKYHIFSLTPPPGTATYPERLKTTWHHTASENLVNWHDLGPALVPGGPGEPDADGCWTGSVLFGEGMFHAFYTGYSIRAQFPQTICHAFSVDGVEWTKNPNNPCLVPKTDLYESLDWRDPYPMPVDPFWEASVASMVSSALPGPDGPRVAEDFFAFQDGESIDIKILVDHDLIEVFVGRKVALNYRWYDAAEFAVGVIVQDGSAEYEDIAIAACI